MLKIAEQARLFPLPGPGISAADIQEITRNIPGLTYRLAYITEHEEQNLLAWVDGQQWITDLQRRVQHYGWRYDYKARKIDSAMQIGELPGRLADLAVRLCKDGYTRQPPDQVIVNEYEPGQGIAPHVDCEPCFGDTIITISLGSACIMDFTRRSGNKTVAPVWLEPRSVIAMTAAARYQWRHGIAKRRSDAWQGIRYDRTRRVSLTFRTVIHNSC